MRNSTARPAALAHGMMALKSPAVCCRKRSEAVELSPHGPRLPVGGELFNHDATAWVGARIPVMRFSLSFCENIKAML